MRELVHPNLVNYEELFLERHSLMLVMEYMPVSTSAAIMGSARDQGGEHSV
jgi:hypothetical protein